MKDSDNIFILVCGECGHREKGSPSRALMLKVRMLNHVTREHPELVEEFKNVIVESAVPASR